MTRIRSEIRLPVHLEDVEAAARRIEPFIRRTPTMELWGPSGLGLSQLLLKVDSLQVTGSFKVRGALNRVLSAVENGDDLTKGIIAASGGNAGIAAAYAARCIDVRAKVFVPITVPRSKVEKLEYFGAEVVVGGENYAAAFAAAKAESDETGTLFVHAYDQPEVIAGQGTVALELRDQAHEMGVDIARIVVAVGGGGLVSGIAAAADGNVEVWGVEPELCPALHLALEAGGPVAGTVGGVAVDALGASRLGDLCYAMVVSHNVRSLLVSDIEIVAARNELWRNFGIVVEHGAATAFAARAKLPSQHSEGSTAIVLCGSNTDPSTLR